MTDNMLAQEIEHQITTSQRPIASIMGDSPIWYDEQQDKINEALLVTDLIDKYGLTRIGKIVHGKTGQIVTPDALKRFIAHEISPFVPNNTARRIDPIYKLLRIYIPEPQSTDGLRIITAAELKTADLKKPEFVVAGLLPCGLAVLAAPPKIGKSWLCLALADAVADGSKFWGFDTKQGAVLYMALEDSKYRLRERLQMIGSSMPDNLSLVYRGAKKIDGGLCDQISAWIDERQDARLVIVDTLARVKGSAAAGLNGYEADTQQFAPLQELAITKDISILVVTHFSKAKQFSPDDPFERISGTTGLFGVADAAWIIYGKRGQEMTLKITGRDALDAEYKLAQEKNMRWRLIGESEQLEEQRRMDAYKDNKLAQTIKALVNEGGRWEGTATQLQEEVMQRTQTVPATSCKELGVKLLEIQELLLTIDGIMFTKAPGGKRGRGYRFERAGNTFGG